MAVRPAAPRIGHIEVNILALETTELTGSVAARRDGKLLAEQRLPDAQRSAASLVPGIGRLLAEVGWRPADVQLVATCVGPGSFTGLRVGVTAAKTFAYCVGAGVLGVDTLEAIAAACPAEIDRLAVAVDAQRGQVAAAEFGRGPDGWPAAERDWHVEDVDAWLGRLAPGTFVVGPILRKLAPRVPATLRLMDPRFWAASAAAVAEVAEHWHAAGRRDDLWKLLPRYSRKAAAEEKWEQKTASKDGPLADTR